MAQKTSKKKKKAAKRGSGVKAFFTVFFTVLLVVFMIGVITAGAVALTVFGDLGLIKTKDTKSVEEEVANVDYMDLENYLTNQAKTTIIYKYDSDGELVEDARLHGSENRLIASLDEIPLYTQRAVVALEDERFDDHKGVDWIGTVRSIVTDLTGGDLQGGSTITQQLIKNLTGDNKRTVVRKYREIKSALALERHFSKAQILEGYLNTIYLDQGCYGIKTGAEYYFGKSVSDLTLMESAILVSITNAPRKFDPILNYDNNRRRAEHCLNKMEELGFISPEEHEKALKEKIEFVGKLSKKNKSEDEESEVSVTASEYQSWYTDYIINTVIEDLQKAQPITANQAWRMVYFGGLEIISAVDDGIQTAMDEIYATRKGLPEEDEGDPNPLQGASVVMDYEGRILGIAGALDPKTGNRVLSYATGGDPRNPGSSIKPLSAYAPAIDGKFYQWSDYLPNYGISVSFSDDPWPSNYHSNYGAEDDLRNLADAIAPSLNTIPARIVDHIGLSFCYSYVRDRFHLSTLDPQDEGLAALAIGEVTYGVTPLDMAAAYAVFGNGGTYYKPYCYYEVRDSEGNVLLKPDKTGQRAIAEGTAEVMLHLLQCPVYRGDGTVNPFRVDGFTTYGKSGTSSSDWDKWVVGGTPYYVCASWTGFKQRKPISQYYGRNPAGTLFKEVMDTIHEDLEEKEFERSSEAVPRTFCCITGGLASSSCYDTETGWFRVDDLPGYCTACASGYRPGGPDDPNNPSVPDDYVPTYR